MFATNCTNAHQINPFVLIRVISGQTNICVYLCSFVAKIKKAPIKYRSYKYSELPAPSQRERVEAIFSLL
jgi:hypothetical protein